MISDVISVVDVFPFVPVIPIHCAREPVPLLSELICQANSTSEITGILFRAAHIRKSLYGENPGDVTMQPTVSHLKLLLRTSANVYAAGFLSSTVMWGILRPVRMESTLEPPTPRPATIIARPLFMHSATVCSSSVIIPS